MTLDETPSLNISSTPNALNFLAGPHTLAAEDTLAGVADKEGIAGVNERRPFYLLEALLADADVGRNSL